jgi:metallo-beta-lactamase family protein
MQMKLRFLGAAQNVTGSRHMLEVNGIRLLVDCGLYQERQYESRNWEPFDVPASSIDAVLLTHAHLDHCGLLPKLAKEGFKGPIYCTAATAEIARLVLLDSAKLQEEDAAFKRKRHEREGRKGRFPEVPLYDTDDVEACDPLWRPVEYKEMVKIGPDVEASFHEAGHVLGSSVIHVSAEQNGEVRSVLFSGDVGRIDRPIVRDPERLGDGDYVLVESTYGDRVHDIHEDIKTKIAQTINGAKAAGGNVVVPSFALERSQDVMYYINQLLLEKAIPHLRVFLDSPMARSITKVFRKHVELFDEETREFIRNGQSPFEFPGLTLIETTEESKSINHLHGTNVVIAGSGMCTGGRIKHHLVNNIGRRQSTIMFVGYQAAGTLGRLIVDGQKEVRILGQTYPVRAKVVQIEGFSAHADREELLRWLGTLQKPPRCLFVVHGEAASAQSFAAYVREKTGWKVLVPEFRQEVLLN